MGVLNSNDTRYNKLMIRGPFGVGKSILLRDKAIQLNEQPEYKGKIMYVLGDKHYKSQRQSMLYFRMKIELEGKYGVKVEEIESIQVILKYYFFLTIAKKSRNFHTNKEVKKIFLT